MNEPKPSETTQGESRQLATIQLPTGQLIPVSLDDDQSIDRFWAEDRPTHRTNFPAGDPHTELLVARCLGQADKKSEDCTNVPLRIIGYVAHVAPMGPNEEGEIGSPLQVIMVLEDGSTISTRSGGIVRVMRALAKTRGPGAWVPPVAGTIKKFPSKPPRSYLVLALDTVQPTTAKKK